MSASSSNWSQSGTTLEALEAQAILERALVLRAAQRRTEADLTALEDHLRRVLAARDHAAAFVARDHALRRRIARASRSRHLASAAAAVLSGLEEEHATAARAAIADGSHESALAARAALVDAIATRDGEAALVALGAMSRQRAARLADAHAFTSYDEEVGASRSGR